MDKAKLKSLLIPPYITIKQTMKKLDETAEKILFVVNEDNVLLGTITDGDIRRRIINGCDFDEKIINGMTKNFLHIRFDMPEKEKYANQLMIENKIEQIPVLDDSGKIIDVILWSDILLEKKQLHPKILYPNQVVIMAGGKGTRLDPFTKILPKPLIPIGHKPFIKIIIKKFY